MNNKKLEAVAMVAYNVDQFFSQTLSKDHRHVSWANANAYTRHQVMSAVRKVCDAGPDGMDGKELHEARRAELRANGWKFGVSLDLEKKASPMVTAYDKLNENQVHRDGLFLTVVASMRTIFGV